jgi:hypothetical protein
MQTFIIFQISLRNLTDEINRIGWTEAAKLHTKVDTHLECGFQGSKNFKPAMFADYNVVATIEADDLEQAFAISNIGSAALPVGEEAQVIRFRKMHSLSVGDIVLDKSGHFHMVDGCGFAEIEVAA